MVTELSQALQNWIGHGDQASPAEHDPNPRSCPSRSWLVAVTLGTIFVVVLNGHGDEPSPAELDRSGDQASPALDVVVLKVTEMSQALQNMLLEHIEVLKVTETSQALQNMIPTRPCIWSRRPAKPCRTYAFTRSCCIHLATTWSSPWWRWLEHQWTPSPAEHDSSADDALVLVITSAESGVVMAWTSEPLAVVEPLQMETSQALQTLW